MTSRGNRCIHTYTVVVLLLLQSCYKDRDSDVAKRTYCSIPLMSVSEYLDCCQFALVIRANHTYMYNVHTQLCTVCRGEPHLVQDSGEVHDWGTGSVC